MNNKNWRGGVAFGIIMFSLLVTVSLEQWPDRQERRSVEAQGPSTATLDTSATSTATVVINSSSGLQMPLYPTPTSGSTPTIDPTNAAKTPPPTPTP